jgi:hypothetical protein
LDEDKFAESKNTSNPPRLSAWWQSNSPLWWLNHAATDLDKKRHEIIASIATTSAVLDGCKSLIDDMEKDTLALIKYQQERDNTTDKQIVLREKETQESYAKNPEYRASLKEKIDQLYRLRRTIIRSMEERLQGKNDFIRALEEEQWMRGVDHKDLTVRLERSEVIIRLARSTHSAVNTMIASRPKIDITQSYIVARLSIIHDLCCVHGRRNEPYQRLREIVNNGVLSSADKAELTIQQERHFRHYQDRYISIVAGLNATAEGHLDGVNIDILQNALDTTKKEWNDLLEIFLGAEKLLEDRKAAFDQPIIIASHAPAVVSLAQLMGDSWGQIKNVEHAKAILDEPDNRGISVDKNLGEILRDFFISPDVAPIFENISNLTKAEFFDLIATLLDDDYAFTRREIEAFLVNFNIINELFDLNGDYVSASGDGWELVDEAPIGGPPRKLNLLSPPQAEEFAAWLVEHQEPILVRLKIAGVQRDTEENALLYVIQKYCPYPIDDEALKSLFGYFSQTGRFFR